MFNKTRRKSYRSGAIILTRIIDIGKIESRILKTHEFCGDAKIMLIAKADCYGSGSLCAHLVEDKVDYFGVARAAEGARLRSIGVNKPIIVLSHAAEQLPIEKEYRLIPSVGSAIDLIAADNYGLPEAHISVDTGMNRYGFKSDYAEPDIINDNYSSIDFANSSLIQALDTIKNLQISGLLSHIYHDSRLTTTLQSLRFDNAAQCISKLLGYTPIRHLWASGGIARYKDYKLPCYDMVRLGLSAYDNANYIISNVLAVKQVIKGETIGYGASYTAPRDMRIAIIEGGYADGIPRNFNGVVIINGSEVNVVGYVCMDVFMADVTNIECKAGTRVVLLDNDKITLDYWAARTNKCKYEVLTGMRGRYKYVYLR